MFLFSVVYKNILSLSTIEMFCPEKASSPWYLYPLGFWAIIRVCLRVFCVLVFCPFASVFTLFFSISVSSFSYIMIVFIFIFIVFVLVVIYWLSCNFNCSSRLLQPFSSFFLIVVADVVQIRKCIKEISSRKEIHRYINTRSQ